MEVGSVWIREAQYTKQNALLRYTGENDIYYNFDIFYPGVKGPRTTNYFKSNFKHYEFLTEVDEEVWMVAIMKGEWTNEGE